MSLSNAVRVNFINIGSIKTNTNSGVYEVDDVAVSLDDHMSKWYLSAYDMDSTFDLDWNGEILECYDSDMPNVPYNNKYSSLLQYIWDNYHDEYVERYIELRKSVLSYSSIIEEFKKYIGVYGEDVYIQDTAIYPDIPSVTSNTLKSLRNFVRDRLEYLDSGYGVVI